MIAALFVQTNGCYFGLPDVDPWDEQRDARLYNGPWPVVAHPPCARWGRFWRGSPTAQGFSLGDDGGCFASALSSVRRFGGVLEHPKDSHAWATFGITRPRDGWTPTTCGGWTCCVEQGNYGHRARKATWLYLFGAVTPTELRWGRAPGCFIPPGEVRRATRKGIVHFMSKRQRAATPPGFRDLLLSLAGMCLPPLNPRGHAVYHHS